MPVDLHHYLPEFPRTRHLPYRPNRTDGDLVASVDEVSFLFSFDDFIIEEKIDGSNCGMMLFEDNPVIRNRDHILKKGYLKDTPAKIQFRSTWNWFYDNKEKFEKLQNITESEHVAVYGEWCLALHGVKYNKLPSYFIAFDVFIHNTGFLDSTKARKALQQAGFDVAPLLHDGGPIKNWQTLEEMCEKQSAYGEEKVEGIYIKLSDDCHVTNRYKLLRSDYVQGSRWNPDEITKQELYKG